MRSCMRVKILNLLQIFHELLILGEVAEQHLQCHAGQWREVAHRHLQENSQQLLALFAVEVQFGLGLHEDFATHFFDYALSDH